MDEESKIVKQSIEIGGKQLELEVGRFAEQANAAVIGRYGDTIILGTVVAGIPREDMGYFPLFVEFQEKLYAGGRIKGSRWVKREGRPSDEAVLNARLVDRSVRPLFPKGFQDEVQVILTVLSVDSENDPDVLAIVTASAALAISDLPWDGPIGALRLGFIPKEKNNQSSQVTTNQLLRVKEGDFIVNPTYQEREYSDLDLVIAAKRDAVVMVEAGANEIPEKVFMSALTLAQKETEKIIALIEKLAENVGKKKRQFEPEKKDPDLEKLVKKQAQEILKDIASIETVQEKLNSDAIVEAIVQENPEFSRQAIKDMLFELIKKEIREEIFKKNKRPDGRKPEDIRPISIEVGVLPRTHGSAMFKRGKTQALTITTLAAPSLEQWIESMEGEGTKRFMHHYYMPPYSVGEVRRLGWPSRREIGHGALAERALEPMIPAEEDFPYTIRVVSEILSSNGSTSMAATCGTTLSLMDSGVPLKKPVAGIAMGLIVESGAGNKSQVKYSILSDIQGFEDHVGDMDFKVAGTKDGITAIQMDVKIGGVKTKVLEEALDQALKGRLFILEKMAAALPAPRAQLSKYAPKVEVVKIEKDQIGEVIGPGGKTIRQIIAETGAAIDVEDDGTVTISGTDADAIRKAVAWVTNLTRKVQAGEEFEGTVKRIEPFGVFVEVLPGKEGLLHVSKMSAEYISDPSQIVALGDKLTVEVAEIDDLGRINLRIPGVQRSDRSAPTGRWQGGTRGPRQRPPHHRHRR